MQTFAWLRPIYINRCIKESPTDVVEDILTYRPIQDVAPSAVRIADAIDAINCTINLVVSFLFIISSFLFYPFTFLLLI